MSRKLRKLTEWQEEKRYRQADTFLLKLTKQRLMKRVQVAEYACVQAEATVNVLRLELKLYRNRFDAELAAAEKELEERNQPVLDRTDELEAELRELLGKVAKARATGDMSELPAPEDMLLQYPARVLPVQLYS